MVRHLLLLRHAKSAWPPGVADLDRPLAPRGERDTATVGAFLNATGALIDDVVCSPAVRTRDTAERVLAAADSRAVVHVDAELYDGDVFQVVRERPPGACGVLLVGHEPELVELLRTMCGADVRMPTAALAVLEVEAPWDLQPAGRAQLLTLVTPRLLAAANWTTV